MEKNTKDIVINVNTEWENYQVSLNWDSDSSTLIRHFTNILKGMTFTTSGIVDGLREVANEIEEDVKYYNKEINENIEEYGTTD